MKQIHFTIKTNLAKNQAVTVFYTNGMFLIVHNSLKNRV
jgi:hypothetical protein